MTHARRSLGASGEEVAAGWYRQRGYEVVARNWRCREGEIDLVLRRGRTIVFCEVKTRTSTAFGVPAEAVTPTKQRRLRGLGIRWLRESGVRAADIRFDVASVLAGQVEVLEAAF
jgi:putative endonuclease